AGRLVAVELFPEAWIKLRCTGSRAEPHIQRQRRLVATEREHAAYRLVAGLREFDLERVRRSRLGPLQSLEVQRELPGVVGGGGPRGRLCVVQLHRDRATLQRVARDGVAHPAVHHLDHGARGPHEAPGRKKGGDRRDQRVPAHVTSNSIWGWWRS